MMPRWVPFGAAVHDGGEQTFPWSAVKPCLSQLWPICSNRPFFRRNMFCPITGCSAVPAIQFSQQDPMLQEVVPTDGMAAWLSKLDGATE